jgi:hypothetical protein
MSKVAALYVETGGVYYGLEDVDPWDEARDARLYAGPWPVVAHPPCNKWSPLAYINRRRIPGYEIGDDGGCFEAALNAVRTYGGVLEHPARSLAWKHFGLTTPERGRWLQGPWPAHVTEVDLCRYGHQARKRTWLYVLGPYLPDMDWSISDSGAIVSGFTHQSRGEHVACEHRRVRPKEASRTPAAFRDELLDIARALSATLELAHPETRTSEATTSPLTDRRRPPGT